MGIMGFSTHLVKTYLSTILTMLKDKAERIEKNIQELLLIYSIIIIFIYFGVLSLNISSIISC